MRELNPIIDLLVLVIDGAGWEVKMKTVTPEALHVRQIHYRLMDSGRDHSDLQLPTLLVWA